MGENAEQNNNQQPASFTWPLDPVTQGTLRRWLGSEPVDASIRYVVWRVWDYATFLATGNVAGGDFECPFDGTITEVYAYSDTAGTTNTTTVDINKSGTTILSTKITIDSTEKTSRTAATPPVISVSSITEGNIITVDIDAVQTSPARGLTVVLVIST